jgi:hypothetical protein
VLAVCSIALTLSALGIQHGYDIVMREISSTFCNLQHVFTTPPIRNYQDILENLLKVEALGITSGSQENKDFAGSKYYVFALYYLGPIWQSHSCTQPMLLDKKSNYYRPTASFFPRK